MPTVPAKPRITLDGNLSDWVASERIDRNDLPGYALYAQAQDDMFYFALSAPLPISANTTFWFNTDQNAATGYQIFGFAGGAEFNVNIKADGTAALYTGGAGQTLVLDNIPIAYSADHQTIEFAVPKAAIGNPEVISTLFDVNDTVFGPSNYSLPPYVAYNNDVQRTNPTHRIGIVYSATTAAHYFSETAYSQLFMAVQSQAMQAGISFDLLTESDLTNLSKLANYDALVFPSFANVQASQVTAITNTLLEATKEFGIGLITAGNFMTNDETGAALAGDSYSRMKLLFDATRLTGGFPADVTVTSSDTTQAVIKTAPAGTVIHTYTGVAWDAFQSVSGTGQTIETETVGGQSYAAAIATQTGGKNVLFSTPGVMADSNMLWQAVDYVAKDPGISVSLQLSRFKAIVASRTDMDQAMEVSDVSPGGGAPGIYDKLLPILAQWKQQFNFVGSFYVDIGNDPANGESTNWAVSAPYYAQLLALGNELGTHSITHPENTNILTAAQIQTEFQQSKQIIEQQMSAYLGTPFTVTGAAVPGASELLPTSEQIIQYFNYITGGYSSIGAGYPGAFGYLTPAVANAVYLAPDTSFDFTLAEYKNLAPAAVEAAWAHEWSDLTSNANLPIVLWPWHDYGAAAWETSPPTPSPYTLAMFTDWIQRASQSGAEFVTEADLASRIASFAKSGVTSTVSGNTVTVTVTSAHAGDFALKVGGSAGQVIQNVSNWYAYDTDSLFLPETGGSFTINLGATQDDVTHIAALPMRGDLLSVIGDGLNLSFSMVGEGDVLIDLGAIGNRLPFLTGAGASVASLIGDQLDVLLTGLGEHDVSVRMLLAAPVAVVNAVIFSADTGTSATDLVTNVAAQTVTGTLSAPLAAGEAVKVSFDNGLTWATATASAGASTFTLSGVVLNGGGTLVARVENSDGVASAAFSHGFTLDQTPPAESASIVAMTADTGTAGDFVTYDGSAGRTVSGTLSAGLAPDERLRVSLDGGVTWLSPTVTGTSWAIIDAAGHASGWTIEAQVVDLAGNFGALATRTVTLDTSAPATPSAPDLADASDTGASATDNVTKVATPVFTGTAEVASTVTLFDGSVLIGTGVASASGVWSITSKALGDGVHSISAKASDLAGNVSLASAALAVTIDTLVPAVPSTPKLATASDSGRSATDKITNVRTPTFTGTAEAGSTVTLLDGAVVIGSATASGSGAWSITSKTLADGVHTISAKANDLAGNVSAASGTVAVTIDTVALPTTPRLTAASDTGRSATDAITNDKTPSFTGTAEAGSTVTLYRGTARIGTGVADASGSWSITSSALPEGVSAITATVTDVAGNVSPASAALSVTIDTKAPSAPSRPALSVLSNTGISATDNITRIAAPTFTGIAEAGAAVTLLDGGVTIGSSIASSLGVWSIQAPTLKDGVHTISAKATDIAGNVGAASPALAVTIDTIAPAAPQFTSATASALAGRGEAGDVVTVLNGTTVLGSTTVAGNGTWSWQFAPSATARTVTAVQTDKAGNVSPGMGGVAVIGTAGSDTLAGGAGNDLLVGGAGADRFVFGAVFGHDVIADFTPAGAAHDVINFHGSATLNSFAAVMSHAAQVGTAVVLLGDAASTLTLNNVNRTSLTAADFSFG